MITFIQFSMLLVIGVVTKIAGLDLSRWEFWAIQKLLDSINEQLKQCQ